jgi:hypothetical protein
VLLGYRVKEQHNKHIGPGFENDPRVRRYFFCPKNKDGPTTTGKIELPFNEVTASFSAVDPPGKRMRDADLFDDDARHP